MADKHYTLRCPVCNTTYSGMQLKCMNDDSLLRTEYSAKQLNLRPMPGMGKFRDWLPIDSDLTTEAAPISYKSEGLAKELGLSNLYISFSGYWPERNAKILTCSFKELEAHPTMQKIKDSKCKSLVLASVGNTARAFAHVSAMTGIDVYIVVPRCGIPRMWLPEEPTDSIHLIRMAKNNDYTDAIALADRIAKLDGMLSEGGARNVARRDGMGTVMLDAAVTIGKMPQHYFQAIGSGTGGIAAWEAALRLRADGRFGDYLPRLHLAQNLPFAPMYSAWKEGRRELIKEIDLVDAKARIEVMYANVLSNRVPPYGIPGGVFDALTDTNGTIYGIENDEAKAAKELFESVEGIDILPPSAVGVASLIKAVESGEVGKDDIILLNIAGGGTQRLKEDYHLTKIKPIANAPSPDIPLESIIDLTKFSDIPDDEDECQMDVPTI